MNTMLRKPKSVPSRHGGTPHWSRAWKSAVILAGLAFLLLAACGGDGPKANVILITVDTLRPDRLGCYGFPLDTSPALDRFAKKALVFEKAYANAPSTCPSLASLMTSLMPAEAGVYSNMHRLNPGVPTLAQFLAKRGFETAAFVSNFVISKGTGFERGFELYNDTLPNREPKRAHIAERTAKDTTAAVLKWLTNGPEEPFFLWVHYQDPHGPYMPPASYENLFLDKQDLPQKKLAKNKDNKGIGGIPLYQQLDHLNDLRSYAARYLGEIRYFDDSFARLEAYLESSGLYGRSLVVFSADHGEGMGEHDYFFAHGEYLYENQIRVPLMMRIPGRAPARIEGTAALADLYPTLLHLLGFEAPRHVKGVNLLEEKSKSHPIFCSAGKSKFTTRNRWALLWKNYKIILSEPGAWELYHLAEDPGEEKNIVESSPELSKNMKRKLLQMLSECRKAAKNPTPIDLDEETVQKLKGLGYGGF